MAATVIWLGIPVGRRTKKMRVKLGTIEKRKGNPKRPKKTGEEIVPDSLSLSLSVIVAATAVGGVAISGNAGDTGNRVLPGFSYSVFNDRHRHRHHLFSETGERKKN